VTVVARKVARVDRFTQVFAEPAGAERLGGEHSFVDAMPVAVDFMVCALQTSPPHHADAEPDGS